MPVFTSLWTWSRRPCAGALRAICSRHIGQPGRPDPVCLLQWRTWCDCAYTTGACLLTWQHQSICLLRDCCYTPTFIYSPFLLNIVTPVLRMNERELHQYGEPDVGVGPRPLGKPSLIRPLRYRHAKRLCMLSYSIISEYPSTVRIPSRATSSFSGLE